MATATEERLISADDHVEMSHDRVKEFLASKHHAGYDAGVDEFYAAMAKSRSSEANQRWRNQNEVGSKETTGGTQNMIYHRHAAAGRVGHSDPVERLKDMDVDGVAVSSSYCEVSAFRYLYLIKDGPRGAGLGFREGTEGSIADLE